jgi:hypothetical protein
MKERKSKKNRKERNIERKKNPKSEIFLLVTKDRRIPSKKDLFLQVSLLFVDNAQTLTPSRCCYFL